MKAKTIYECEFCHTTFTDEEKCKKCENSHTKVNKIVKVYYKHPNNITPALRDTGAPRYIDVLLNNGTTVKYALQSKI